MAFNSSDTAAFKGVWVFCEQREGVIMSTSYQLLSEGHKLANDLGVELCGVVLGKDIKEEYLKALGGYGADRVYICDHPLLKDYTTDAYTKVICDLVEDKKPEIFLIGATNIGRDLGPRVAARLKTGLTADCTHLDVDVEKYKAFLKTTSTIDVDNTKFEANTNLKMTRPAFGGHLMATIVCPDYRPQMSTVRPGVMQTQAYNEETAAKTVLEKVDVQLTKEDIHVDLVEIVKSAKKAVDLIGADVVVSVAVVSAPTPSVVWRSLRSWPTSWAAWLALPVPWWTTATSVWTTRLVRPVRPFTPRSTWPWAFPAPFSTCPACRTLSASSP